MVGDFNKFRKFSDTNNDGKPSLPQNEMGMEYSSKTVGKTAMNKLKSKKHKSGLSVLEMVISTYDPDFGRILAQEMNQDQIDPNATQPGQTVYDQSGNPYMVMGQEEQMSNQQVLVPADQANQSAPAGVKVVDDSEFQSTYNVQNPTQTGVQGPVTAESMSSAAESPRGTFPSSGGLSDTNIADGLTEDKERYVSALRKVVSYSSPYKRTSEDFKIVSNETVEFQSDQNQTEPDTSESEEQFNSGQSGYTDIMNFIKDQVSLGLEPLDVVLLVGENFDRELGMKVLNEARAKGII